MAGLDDFDSMRALAQPLDAELTVELAGNLDAPAGASDPLQLQTLSGIGLETLSGVAIDKLP